MTTKEITNIIKQKVSIIDAVQFYGFTPNKSGFIICPFHLEQTASCKIYESSFYCFGCGAGGDVIKFVELLFDLSFKAAIIRINTDFDLNIGLSTNKLNSNRKSSITNTERRQREDELKRFRENYDKLSIMFRDLWLKQKTQPLSATELQKLAFLEEWLYNNPYK